MSASGPEYNAEYGPSADRARRLMRQRRRLRWPLWLGIFTLVLVVGVAGVVAWVIYAGAPARAARLANRLGGKVTYYDDRPRDGRVLAISFAGVASFGDEQLGQLTPWWWRFPEIKELDLTGSGISDAGLSHLAGAPFANLRLDRTAVTETGLARLAENAALRSLSLIETQTDDVGLIHLTHLPNLTTLYLDQTAITDAGLAELAKIETLRYISLGQTPAVTDEGVDALRERKPDLKITR